MTDTLRRRPVREALLTAVSVGILAGLGTWQLERKEWKDAIVTRLEEAYSHAPEGDNAPLPQTLARLSALSQEEEPMDYIVADLSLLRDKAVLIGPKTHNGMAGYHLLVPAVLSKSTPENGAQKPLFVHLGWVDALWSDNTADRLSRLPQDLRVGGIARLPDWSSFTSRNSPENDLWFRPDPLEIARAKDLAQPYPFVLYAQRAEPALDTIRLNESGWKPRNKHAQYAAFWFTLAACFLMVFGIYTRKKSS